MINILDFRPNDEEKQCGDEYGENTAHDWSLQSHEDDKAYKYKYENTLYTNTQIDTILQNHADEKSYKYKYGYMDEYGEYGYDCLYKPELLSTEQRLISSTKYSVSSSGCPTYFIFSGLSCTKCR